MQANKQLGRFPSTSRPITQAVVKVSRITRTWSLQSAYNSSSSGYDSRRNPHTQRRAQLCRASDLQDVQDAAEEGTSEQQLSEEEVDDLLEDAAGFICVMDDLRPLDPASYNAFYELWTRIAKIPPQARYRLLALLEPGCARSMWKASLGRYVLDEARSAQLFAEASVWDDFPDTPGQVFEYEGRAERYQFESSGGGGSSASGRATGPTMVSNDPAGFRGGRRSVRLEIDTERTALAESVAGGGPGSVAPWLRPVLAAVRTPVTRFRQLFFVPPEGCFGGYGQEGEWAGGGGVEAGSGVPLVYSRVLLPAIGPIDRWWEPIYCRLRVELTLTPLPADAGADLQLLYPADPECGHEEVEALDKGQVEPGSGPAAAGGSVSGAASGGGVNSAAPSASGGGAERKVLGPWELVGSECLPPGRMWPEPAPLEHPLSPFSGGTRDYLRVVGPGVYVGCAYREGPQPGEYRDENFVYFVIARRE